jgi:hypothetical protein
MIKARLNQLPRSFKWAITAFVLLASLGFGVAALMSLNHYGLSHEKTVTYYLGNEAEYAFPKLYSQILQTAHVHSFTMPLVFLGIWIALQFTGLRSRTKSLMVLGGTISIVIYNAAPFLLRYFTPRAAWLFTVGGVGLFVFFLVPAGIVLYDLWFGCESCQESI